MKEKNEYIYVNRVIILSNREKIKKVIERGEIGERGEKREVRECGERERGEKRGGRREEKREMRECGERGEKDR